MDEVFRALADPSRREMLDRLFARNDQPRFVYVTYIGATPERDEPFALEA